MCVSVSVCVRLSVCVCVCVCVHLSVLKLHVSNINLKLVSTLGRRSMGTDADIEAHLRPIRPLR